MKLKEKCIYYNNVRNAYYFVLSADDYDVYGRCGEILNPTFLDSYRMMLSRKGISFKIDDIIINSNYIKNYHYHYDDPYELDRFKFIKELSDKDYFIMKALIESDYDDCNNIIVDLNKCDDDLLNLALEIDQKEDKFYEMNKEIRRLKRTLFSRLEKKYEHLCTEKD